MEGEDLLREYVGRLLAEAPLVRSLSGSDSNEAYDREMRSDGSYQRRSVYVPDEDKDEINNWLDDMGLSHHRKKRAPSK